MKRELAAAREQLKADHLARLGVGGRDGWGAGGRGGGVGKNSAFALGLPSAFIRGREETVSVELERSRASPAPSAAGFTHDWRHVSALPTTWATRRTQPRHSSPPPPQRFGGQVRSGKQWPAQARPMGTPSAWT